MNINLRIMTPLIVMSTILFFTFTLWKYPEILPDDKKKLVQQTQTLLNALQKQDETALSSILNQDLAKRLPPKDLILFAQKQQILPLTHWEIMGVTHHEKLKKGVTHAESNQGLLRFDFKPYGGWKLSNFCRVDDNIAQTSQQFVQYIQQGQLEKAQQMAAGRLPTVKNKHFTLTDLQALHFRLKKHSETKALSLKLSDNYLYEQMLQIGQQKWKTSLIHKEYGKQGCEFWLLSLEEK